ncbi:serine/threonine protein kinase [Ligilactobacillus agilis]|uniref:Serine/threonine protein kinase n=1 Tax=Ligilactobacillus agilis TaxID=1601 RepID=A0A226RHN6_9LACO|nr:amino acid permease [Ligilactobacillus agilis]OXC06566.1 serine/threonine protein kinase [Ligilactobacillus agilis]OXC07984.1 serine/threonine protein kinase [Ligilactobacillus agilis]OXC08732.1 serine/threonine protein kinase [Ligilactobacillus agilis]OXS39209.1 serine/threonine protein kinase [Ligilactobacillus agilis]OXS42481.1 serine/threonine protein kinase [Ligilactobacillus agilis]
MKQSEEQIGLNRSLGLISSLSLVIGTVIGSGIFFKQAAVLDYAHSTNLALVAWLVGGLITMASGLTIAEIGSQMPHTGGLYVYLENIYGKFWGFLAGWMQIIVYGPTLIAALGSYLATLLVAFFDLPKTSTPLLAVIVIALIAAFNLLSNRYGAAFQVITTVGKLLPIAAIIIFGLLFGKANAFNQVATTSGSVTLNGFGMAILATLFAYDGWVLIANMGGEIKNPQKLLPKAIVFGIGLVLIIYMLVTAGIFRVVPASLIHRLGDQAAAHFATIAFGQVGGKLLNIGIIISIAGCINGKVMTFPRIMYAMAKNDELPFSKQLAYLNKRMRTPMVATLTVCSIAALMAVTVDADRLSELCIFTVYLFYVLAFFGLFKLRRLKTASPFRVPLYPFTPIVAILGGVFVLVSELNSDLTGVLASIFFVALGIPVYLIKCKK